MSKPTPMHRSIIPIAINAIDIAFTSNGAGMEEFG